MEIHNDDDTENGNENDIGMREEGRKNLYTSIRWMVQPVLHDYFIIIHGCFAAGGNVLTSRI